MPAPRKYPQELRDRAIRLVAEAMAEDGSLSMNEAVKRIGERVEVVPDGRRLVRGGSGPRIGRCGRRCAHRAAPNRRVRYNGSSGV